MCYVRIDVAKVPTEFLARGGEEPLGGVDLALLAIALEHFEARSGARVSGRLLHAKPKIDELSTDLRHETPTRWLSSIAGALGVALWLTMLSCAGSRGRFGDDGIPMSMSFGAEAEGAARASAGTQPEPQITENETTPRTHRKTGAKPNTKTKAENRKPRTAHTAVEQHDEQQRQGTWPCIRVSRHQIECKVRLRARATAASERPMASREQRERQRSPVSDADTGSTCPPHGAD
eukprot:scaffold24758_cov129-Isochrysis_galbana.AAC.2